MHRRGQLQGWGLVGLFIALLASFYHPSYSDVAPTVICSSPVATVAPGDTGTVYVNCSIYGAGNGSNYYFLNSNNNLISPPSLGLQNGAHQLTAVHNASVVSPDNTVINLAGTASGFTGEMLSITPTGSLQFQYSVATTAQTAAGLYTSKSPSQFQYRLCTSSTCNQHYSGNAPFTLYLNVASTPTTVSCSSPSVNSTPGGGAFSLNVTCTISGSSASKISPSTQNLFSPGTITLSQGSKTISASLQPTVTSPDSSVSSISGTASGGFTGTINSLPAKVMVQYQGTTSATTPAGTYTSSPVTFTWSTI